MNNAIIRMLYSKRFKSNNKVGYRGKVGLFEGRGL